MKTIRAIHDSYVYKERTSRTLPFLGRDKEEQIKAQKTLANSVVGIAGCGGIGGAMALRLARLGIGTIKLADPGNFDWSNVNRQLGASRSNIGKNKAEVVSNIVNDLAGDTNLEIFSEGITVANAKNFVNECDIILDKIDFSIIKEKIALHEAFRGSEQCKYILACSVIGWNAHLYKFEKDSMPLESWYDFLDNQNIDSLATSDKTMKLLKKWAPRFPHFPTFDAILDSIKETDSLPIFAGAPPLAEGFLTQRTVLCLLDKEFPPYAQKLPPIPHIYIYDAATLSGDFYISDGKLKNIDEINQKWKIYDNKNTTTKKRSSFKNR